MLSRCARSPPGWWLSTCGRFREHLTVEVRGNFEWLMLSGSRALEFLGCQGVTDLGNLVLSRRDSLLLDVRSTVPAEEVAHVMLRFPCQPVFFPRPCLILLWIRCVRRQTTLLSRRPCILRRFPGSVQRGRSVQDRLPLLPIAVAPHPWCRVRRSRHRRPLPLLPACRVGSGRGTKAGRRFRLPPPVGALAGYWGRVLGTVRLLGRVLHPLPGLSSSPRSNPVIVPDAPVRISSITGFGPGYQDVGQGCLGDRHQSGSRLLQSSFFWWKRRREVGVL